MEDDNKIYITNSSDLPEVTVTAPRKYFVGYDENVNPVYTTDRTLSQDYLQSQIPVGSTEQKRRQWAFENVGANGQTKPGIQGDAKDISRLVTAGIGSTLAPIAVAPVARAVFPAAKTLASAGRTTWNAVKPGGTIPNWLYRQTFTPQGTLTKGATELLGSTVAGEGLNEILNQKSKSGDWTEDVDHKYFHGDIGNTIGEEGRSMFLTAPLYGTYNAWKSVTKHMLNAGKKGLQYATKVADNTARYISPSYDLYRTIVETTPKTTPTFHGFYAGDLIGSRLNYHVYTGSPIFEFGQTMRTSPEKAYFMRAPKDIDILKLRNGKFRHEVVGNLIIPSGEVNGKFVSYGEPWQEFALGENSALYEFPVGLRRGPSIIATDWKGNKMNYSVDEAYNKIQVQRQFDKKIAEITKDKNPKETLRIRKELLHEEYPELLDPSISTDIHFANQTVIPNERWNFDGFLKTPFWKYSEDPLSGQVQKELMIRWPEAKPLATPTATSSRQKRVVPQSTFYLYTGPKHSINEVVNPDGTVNVRNAMRIQNEVADNIPGAFRMENRLENPKWHKNDPNTFLHTKNVAQSAWGLPIPIGYTKQDQMIAALGHDFGKMISGDGHAENGAGLLYQIFPDITTQQLTAIGQHMGLPTTSLGYTTKMADFMNGKLVRKSKLTQAERLGIPKALRFVPKWHVANYPGYQLKGLISGSPIERQLSKTGTISINLLNAYFNKASLVEREVANKVLAEKFAGQKTIDYNLFKKSVLDELIGSYNRVPLTEYADYGIDRLGFKSGPTLSRQDFLNFLLRNPNINGIVSEDGLGIIRFNPDGGATLLRPRDLYREYGNWMDLPNFKTFTFESTRIPYGNTKHYQGNPIGHSRTYTLPEDPHTLYVMESQSDWALLALRKKGNIDAQSAYEKASLTATKYLQEIELMKANLEKGLAPDGHKIQYEWERRDIEEIIKNTEKQLASNNTRMARFDAILHPEKYVLENYLKQNYLQRQLQENLRYAAEKGLTKMRYPTPETAAKIEGYSKLTVPRPTMVREIELRDLLDKMWKEYYDANIPILYNKSLLELELIGRKNIPNYAKIADELKQLRNIPDKYDYLPQHQTILKKYADFPKLFLKLYKDLKVRTVTDAKGNTWYEVDVPRGYLNREWLFKQGGKINNK